MYFTVGGDATAGTDYTALTGSVTIAASATTADVTVTVTDDTDDEPEEYVTVAIATSAGYAVGDSGSATIAIGDNELPEVSVQKIVDAAETNGRGLFRFSRTLGDLGSELTVAYTVGGSATSGTDFAALSGAVTFGANEATVDVVIDAFADVSTEGTETVSVAIATGAGYTIGTGSASLDLREEAAGAVSGRFWSDTDGDGVRDPGELGLPYRSVFLVRAGEVVAEALTDATGDYSFAQVTAGTYSVLFDVPGDFTSTTTINFTQTATVAPGASVTDIDSGCQPPATPVPPTGKRDGIDWNTFDLSSAQEVTFQGIKGQSYNVQMTGGGNAVARTIKVFVAYPAEAQDKEVMKKTNADSIKYNCHGYSLNLQHVRLSNGSSISCSLIDPLSTFKLVQNQYKGVTNEEAKKAIANKQKVIIAFYNSDLAVVHSAVLASIVLKPNGSLDLSKSVCDSKNGWEPLATNTTPEKLLKIYQANENYVFLKVLK